MLEGASEALLADPTTGFSFFRFPPLASHGLTVLSRHVSGIIESKRYVLFRLFRDYENLSLSLFPSLLVKYVFRGVSKPVFASKVNTGYGNLTWIVWNRF